MHQQQTAYENICGKGEIAYNEQFLLFLQCFQVNQITVSSFVLIFCITSVYAVELEEPKIGILGKGLNKDDNLLCSSGLTIFQTIPCFHDPLEEVTIFAKVEISVTSIFTFSHNVYYPFKNIAVKHYSNYNYFVVLKMPSIRSSSKILSCDEG